MARYLIEDVVLTKDEQGVRIQIRYRGHTTQSVTIGLPKRSYENWTTNPDVIKLIDKAAETLTAEEIASLLSRQGFNSGKGCPFTANIVKRVMYAYSIPSMKERYLDRGYITSAAKAISMGITSSELMRLIRKDKYQGEYISVNSRNECVFPAERIISEFSILK